ncbi:tRNA-dihydrouridine synthase DusB [Olavius sp. associated proteobacterium Delta 1]|nr:tRNA-dihydrouridine synthase DusB [Olavius sp. associated proteobacterium Delta 1]
MKIGTVTLDNNVISAPLAGITNLPFRLMAKKAGCGLVCSEMVSSHGLVYHSRKTAWMLNSAPQEKPLSAQIFGSDPDIMAGAAAIAEGMGVDILDINFGCSVRKVVKTGSGVALMRTPDVARAVLKAVRNAIRIPLTIKIRSGWDASGEQALNIARIAEDCGVDAVAIHPRTAKQLFSGRADWSLIAAVKEKLTIPVIGNGDIFSARDALNMLAETGCDAIMIGRKAIGNPAIFSQVLARIRGDKNVAEDLAGRFDIMIQYLKASVEYLGEEPACRMMRSRLGWFTKEMRNSSKFRESIKHLSTEKAGLELINAYRESLGA